VRIGKVDPKIGIGTDVDSLTLSPVAGNVVEDMTLGIRVEWDTQEAPWGANFILRIDVDSADGDKAYINDVLLDDVDLSAKTLFLEEYGVTVDFSGANDGTYYIRFVYAEPIASDAELKEALETAFEKLYGLDFTYVYVADALFDKHAESIKAIANFAEKASTQFKNVIAAVSTTEPKAKAFSVLKKWVNDLVAAAKNVSLTTEDGRDIGHRITVVPGSGKVSGLSYDVPLAPVVLAYLHTAGVYTGPMNLTLSGVSTDLSLTYSLANELAGARYTVVHTPKGISSDPILVVGQTMATSGSLTKLSTVLVVNEFVNGLKTIADRFLGQPNTATTRMSMQSTMQNFVTSMIQQRKIAGGNVSVTTDPGNVLNGVVVNAQLRAFAEIETVSLKVQFSVVGGELEQA
jgi:hypothetical protein